MKFFVASVSAVGIALLVFLITRAVYMQHKTGKTAESINQITKKIAILTPTLTPSMQCIIEGLRETLATMSTHTVSFKVYNSDGNRTLLRSHVEEICDSNPDTLVTIGAACSQMAKEITTKREILIPIVFSGVEDPVDQGIIASVQSSGNHVTGVSGQTQSYLKKFALIIPFVAPHIKKVLLVCDPTQNGGCIEKEQYQLVEELGEFGIQTKIVNVYNIPEITEKVNPYIDQAQMVITLKEHTLMQGISKVVELCNKARVPLYSQNGEAAKQGACLSLGPAWSTFGTEAAKLVYQIIDREKKPTDIPVTLLPMDYEVVVNRAAAKKQNLPIPQALEMILENSRIL